MWPKSVTAMMFGCASRLADSASRSKRRANSSLPLSSGSSTLMARSRRIIVCSARYTAPMPPMPMRLAMR